jgi:uncharacterized protein (DUF58 family)
VASRSRSVFPLVPKYRVSGLPFGGVSSLRRGHGSDVAGSRAYVRGDPLSTIDWRASARLSTARGADEFVVRERYAEEASRVVVVCDFAPSMGLYPPPFPWLSKPAVVRSVIELIVQSALAAHSAIGYLDFAGAGERGETPYWVAPRARGIDEIQTRHSTPQPYDAPSDGLERGLEFLARFRSELSSGTFIFVISDFLGSALTDSALLGAAARRWEVVPVIVQDPTWEHSFPLVGPLVLPLVDPGGGATLEVRLSNREARARRKTNEQRHRELLARLAQLGLDAVSLETAEDAAIEGVFLDWASRRRDLRHRR